MLCYIVMKDEMFMNYGNMKLHEQITKKARVVDSQEEKKSITTTVSKSSKRKKKRKGAPPTEPSE